MSQQVVIIDSNFTIDTLRPRQNGNFFPGDISKCIILNENVWNWIKLPLHFVPTGPIENILALVQIQAWHRTGDKPLIEAMMSLLADAHMLKLVSIS